MIGEAGHLDFPRDAAELDADMRFIAGRLGMPEDLLTDEAVGAMTDPMMAVLSDGEFTLDHGPMSDELGRWFGRKFFDQGMFQKQLQSMHRNPAEDILPVLDNVAADLGAILGQDFATGGSYAKRIRPQPTTYLSRDRTVVRTLEDQVCFLEQPAEVVGHFGPGIHAQSYLDRLLRPGDEALSYVPITTERPFVGSFIAHYLRAKVQAQLTEEAAGDDPSDKIRRMIIAGRLDIRETGLEAATQALLDEDKVGTFDLIVCSGLHKASRETVQAGLINGERLLKPGGRMLLRFPLAETEAQKANWVDLRDVAAMARELPGSSVDQPASPGMRNRHGVHVASVVLSKT